MPKKITQLATLLILFMILINYSSPVYASTSIPMYRLAGATRYDTSAEISKNGWGQSDYAVIATGENFPDALASAPLAKKYNAPIILTNPDYLSDQSKNELKRLKVKSVFIIGGTGAISSLAEASIQSLGLETTRLAGQDRYETALKIAQEVGTNGEILVATGDSYQDALSIAPIAAIKGDPIIISPKDTIPDSVKNFLSGKAINKTYVIGSSVEISDNVLNQFPNAERIDGQSGYERNIAVLNKFGNLFNFSKIYFATGVNFPDALAGTALAPLNSSPIILVNPSTTSSFMTLIQNKQQDIKDIYALGGEAVLPTPIINQIISVQPIVYMSDVLQPYYASLSLLNVNKPMSLAGKIYTKGYQVFTELSDTKLSFNLGGGYNTISGIMGVDDAFPADETVTIYGDGKLVNTYSFKKGDLPQNFNLNVTGITKLDIDISLDNFQVFPNFDLANVVIQ